MVVRKSVSLLDGEQIISRIGIWQFAHFYRHPKTGREVVLCAMQHVGSKEYYRTIKSILADCDIVLYEPIADSENFSNERVEELQTVALDMNEFVADAFVAYHLGLNRIFNSRTRPELAVECKEFNRFYAKSNWIHADLLSDINDVDNDVDTSFSSKFYERVARLHNAKKMEILNLFLFSLLGMEDGTFSTRDFARDLIKADKQEDLLRILIDATSQRKRDKKCFEVFDSVVAEHNPGKIGIKFGVAHIPNQRRLLEARGYELIKSQKICCIRF